VKDTVKYIFGGLVAVMILAVLFVKAKTVNGLSGVQQASSLINSTASGGASIINAATGGNVTAQGQVS
jgi:hypothetical protein